MLTHPTLHRLHELRLSGMAQALQELLEGPDKAQDLTFEDRLGLLVDREATMRSNLKLASRLRCAKLRLPNACVEDVDFRHPRGLDKSLFLSLVKGDWIRSHDNLAIVGPTGSGKTYLACALAHKACRDGFSCKYFRFPRLLEDLALARCDGRYAKFLASLGNVELLVLDDWGLAPMTAEARRDLLEVLEDRYKTRTTLVTSQLPTSAWHDYLGDPTLADAILDRFIHNAHTISLKGDSMRKTKKS